MRLPAALVLLACAACEAPREAAQDRRQIMNGMTLSQSDKGAPAWTLKSRLAVLREDDKRALLSDPFMEFYREGRAVSQVTALSGEINTETHDVRLSSSVVVDSFEEKSRLTTTELLYSSARRRFTTAAEIHMTRPGGEVRGKGLEATPDLSEIRVFQQRAVLSEARR